MKVLIAPDKFKGSLPAADVAAHLAAGLSRADPDLDIVCVPVADGGDGTLAAAVSAGYRHVPVRVHGPLGGTVDSGYARLGDTAVVELADACGLSRLPGGTLAPLTSTSLGFGELIRAALDDGCRHLVLAVGGSASTDGGAGMLAALGARLLDGDGNDVPPTGGQLSAIDHTDLTGLHPGVAAATVVLACDVDNPLLGPQGAASIYGPQKGCSTADIAALEAGLRHWSTLLDTSGTPGPDGHPAAAAPGSGAAGGVGFAALAVLGATAESGIDLLLQLTGFHRHLPGTDLVITGEGCLDEQTLHGKAPAGVAAAARQAGIPAIAVAGRSLLTRGQLAESGITAAHTLLEIEPDITRCLAEPGPLLERLATERIADQLGRATTSRPHLPVRIGTTAPLTSAGQTIRPTTRPHPPSTSNSQRRLTMTTITWKEKVRAAEPGIGTFLGMGSAVAAEVCALSGFDWLLVDLEHGAGGEDALLGQILAAATHGVPLVVRAESADRIRAGRILDMGAAGVMFPRLDTPAQVAEAIAHLRYPPQGDRGVAGYNRARLFGADGLTAEQVNDTIVGIVQIETLSALNNVEQIAAIPGVDVLFVGPADLSTALGVPGQLDAPAYRSAVARVVTAAGAAGIGAGILARNTEHANTCLDDGFTFVGVGSDATLLASAAKAVTAKAAPAV